MKKLEKKLLEEVNRFRQINKYTANLLKEQEVAPEGELPPPPGDEALPVPDETLPPTDIPADMPAEVPPVEEDNTEEIDITDLVNMTKSIKKDIDNKKSETDGVLNKMDDVFTKLSDLESKLSQMDSIITRIDDLGNKVENMREKTPEERLELRSLDSYPFNQNPQEFFSQKQGEMRASGKNEYVINKQDIESYSLDTIKGTFSPKNQEDEFTY
jgi:hypothetical protein